MAQSVQLTPSSSVAPDSMRMAVFKWLYGSMRSMRIVLSSGSMAQ